MTKEFDEFTNVIREIAVVASETEIKAGEGWENEGAAISYTEQLERVLFELKEIKEAICP